MQAETHVISAVYNGDQSLPSATSSTDVSVAVAPLDFTLTSTGQTTQTIGAGGAANFSYQVSPIYSAYPASVTFTVTGLPTGATYTLSPNTLQADAGTQSLTLAIQMPVGSSQSRNDGLPWSHKLPKSLALLLLPIAGIGRMRRASRSLARSLGMVLVLLAGIAAVSGCGSSNGFYFAQGHNYTITVTATSGQIQHSSTVTLRVQ